MMMWISQPSRNVLTHPQPYPLKTLHLHQPIEGQKTVINSTKTIHEDRTLTNVTVSLFQMLRCVLVLCTLQEIAFGKYLIYSYFSPISHVPVLTEVQAF